LSVALNGNPSQSYEASPATWDHSVTCHPTQVNVPRQPDRPVLDLPTAEGWKAEFILVVGLGCILRWFTCPQTATHPGSNHLIATLPQVKPT